MSVLSVKQDDSTLIHLKQNHGFGWLLFLIGMGVFSVPFFNPEAKGDVWVAYVVGAAFALFGLAVALYRLDIKLNLQSRSYHISKGFVSRQKHYSGSLNDGLVLHFDKQWRSSGSKNKTQRLYWQTLLQIPEEKKAISLHEAQDEQRARQYFEQRAQQLRIKTLDKTGEKTAEKNWDELDDAVSKNTDKQDIQRVNESQPPAGLSHAAISGGVAYTSTAAGLNGATVIGTLFGLPFLGSGLLMLFIGLGLHEAIGWQIQVSGSFAVAIIVGGIFALVGGFIVKISIDHAFTRYSFQFSRSHFTLLTFTYGRQKKEQRLATQAIEGFGLRSSTNSRGKTASKKVELFARTDDEIIKVNDLDAEQVAFLSNVFYQRCV